MVDAYKNTILVQAFATAEDIAGVVVFLTCAREYLTGEIIRVDGGQMAYAPA